MTIVGITSNRYNVKKFDEEIVLIKHSNYDKAITKMTKNRKD